MPRTIRGRLLTDIACGARNCDQEESLLLGYEENKRIRFECPKCGNVWIEVDPYFNIIGIRVSTRDERYIARDM